MSNRRKNNINTGKDPKSANKDPRLAVLFECIKQGLKNWLIDSVGKVLNAFLLTICGILFLLFRNFLSLDTPRESGAIRSAQVQEVKDVGGVSTPEKSQVSTELKCPNSGRVHLTADEK